MKRRALISAVAAAALLIAVPALANDQRPPSPESVRLLTLKAASLIAAEGIDKAREVFHAKGEFNYGEIYVNVIDTNGTWLVYPPNPRNEGKSVLNVKDTSGKLLVQEIIQVARDKGEGWVEYLWLNPASNRIEPKLTFVKYVPERGVITYIGLYK